LQRQLVAFRRVAVQAGKARDVPLEIDPRSLSLVEPNGERAIVPGAYRLFVGGGQPGDATGVWSDITITGAGTVLPH